jgi:hypothetical protein
MAIFQAANGGWTGAPHTVKWARTISLILAVSAILAPLQADARMETGSPLPTEALGAMTFDEEFNGPLDLASPTHPDGRWRTQYWFGDQNGWSSRTLKQANDGQECYVDPAFGYDPFKIDGGVLSLSADHMPPALSAKCDGQPYTSGLLTTEKSFSQLYGYFEIRTKLPFGKGLWPAFWMVPIRDKTLPPEIDVFEAIGDDPNRVYSTVHWGKSQAAAEQKSFPVDVADYSQWHTYGVLWTPDRITWYIDGRQTVSATEGAAQMRTPMYVLLNLSIGGKWPGNPDATTPFPATMQVDYVRVWKLKSQP